MLKHLFLQCFFEHHPKIAKKWTQKNDNFSHFAKHRLIKKTRFVAPLLTQKFLFFKLCVWKSKTLMLNKKHNLKSGNSKDKRKGFETKNKKETKKRERISGKNAIEYFDVVLFMKQKQRRKERKERDKNQETKREQKRKTRRKKETKEQERDREREIEQGASQKGWGRKREKHRKLTKNAFFRGKTGFFLLRAKKGQQKKKQKEKQKNNT